MPFFPRFLSWFTDPKTHLSTWHRLSRETCHLSTCHTSRSSAQSTQISRSPSDADTNSEADFSTVNFIIYYYYYATMKTPALFSLDKQYFFYRHYHTNSNNKRVHYVFVPILMITAFSILSHVTLPTGAPALDLSHVISLIYIIHGLVLSLPIGLSFIPIILAFHLASQAFNNSVGPYNSLSAATILHLTSWFVQFFAHFVFEQRAPAVTRGVLQALSAGPIVLWMDLLFSFGFFADIKARLSRSRVVAKARKAARQIKNEPENQ